MAGFPNERLAAIEAQRKVVADLYSTLAQERAKLKKLEREQAQAVSDWISRQTVQFQRRVD